MHYPKISYITPVFNQVEFIEQTIVSVITQEYPNIEYIIVDGGSTDGTLEIIKKYEDHISKIVSEPDSGMYDALNKGFKLSSGEIMGWINSDDMLLPGAFMNMARLFQDLPQVSWIQGLNSFIDLNGHLIKTNPPKPFSFLKFLNKDFKWVQQESTFWRRELWEKAGGGMDDALKLAGDFELWFRFFQFTKLYNSSLPIGAWRRRDGQISGTHMAEYIEEADRILKNFNPEKATIKKLEKINRNEGMVKTIGKLKIFNSELFRKRTNNLYNLRKIEISYSELDQKFVVI